jgi:hypothetical protein
MSEYEKAKQWMLDRASQHWLEAECLEHFERYIAAGDPPWVAANAALYDWDI